MEEKTRRFEDKGDKDQSGGERRGFQRRKGCRFCGEGPVIDYKDRHLLSNFVTERYKIVPRRISGCCAFHQRMLTTAIKRARHIAVLAYTSAQV